MSINLQINNETQKIIPANLPTLRPESVKDFEKAAPGFPTYEYPEDGRPETSLKVVVEDLKKLGSSPLTKNWQLAYTVSQFVGIAIALVSAIFVFYRSSLIAGAGIGVGILLVGVGARSINNDEKFNTMKPSVEKFFTKTQTYFINNKIALKESIVKEIDLPVSSEENPDVIDEKADKLRSLADLYRNVQFFSKA